jgi:tetratricopeptide (TPR) repeat protein
VTTLQTQRFEQLCQQLEIGEAEAALRGLRDLLGDIEDPWEKTELRYFEAVWLLDSNKIPEARKAIEELKKGVSALVPFFPADEPAEFSVRLTVETMSAEVRVYYRERNNEAALRTLEELLRRYPKSLSTEPFQEIHSGMITQRGLLLANLDRWEEARVFLEAPPSPKEWTNVVDFYLGQCYYTSGDYYRAKSKLLSSLKMNLSRPWEAKARYLLGIVMHHLGDEKSAKREFELCAQLGTNDYLATTKIWEWLEATSTRLGLFHEAEKYRKQNVKLPKPN